MLKFSKITGSVGLFLFYLTIAVFIRNRFPDANSLINALEGVYKNIGYPLIFLGGFLESMFLIGLFVPGSVVLLMGAALSRLGVVDFPYVYFLGTAGLIVGYTVNYFLGRYGWYHVLSFLGIEKGVNKGKEKLKKNQYKALFLGYIIPGSGSLFSTASGIIKMNFRKFLTLTIISQAFWSLVWGTIAYFFGIQIVEFIIKYFIFVLLGIAIVWVVKRKFSASTS